MSCFHAVGFALRSTPSNRGEAAGRNLLGRPRVETHWHGEDGLGDFAFHAHGPHCPEPQRQLAVTALIDAANNTAKVRGSRLADQGEGGRSGRGGQVQMSPRGVTEFPSSVVGIFSR